MKEREDRSVEAKVIVWEKNWPVSHSGVAVVKWVVRRGSRGASGGAASAQEMPRPRARMAHAGRLGGGPGMGKAAAMLKVIAGTTDLGQKNELLQQLGFFYIRMRNNQKAIAVGEALPDPGQAYRLCIQAIFYDDNLSNEQKIAEYKKLLPLFPQCAAGLNGLMEKLQKNLAQQ